MGHPIHKHMSSGQRYDNKQAYNKDLSDSARLHYLENEEKDKNGSPAHMEGGRKNHKMSNNEYSAHLQSPKGKKEHGAGMSRYSVEKGPHAPHGDAPHRKSSPANNLNKGYKSQMGKPSVASMNVDPAEAVMSGKADTREGAGGMSRYKKDHKGMSRAKYGGNKGDESKSKRDY